MQWEPNGDPHVPGSLQAWKNILRQKANAELARNWDMSQRIEQSGRLAGNHVRPLSRRNGRTPAEAYLVLSEIDARRPQGIA